MDNLPLPAPRALTVLCAPAPAGDPLPEFVARLALLGPLTVLDGGNCFPAYRLLQFLRRLVPDPAEAAAGILVRRAFTCHQMLALLEDTPAHSRPYVVLDPLATFYDEQVPEAEAGRLLDGCLRQLERLRQSAPLLVTLGPPRIPQRAAFAGQVCARADRLLELELPIAAITQPPLFTLPVARH